MYRKGPLQDDSAIGTYQLCHLYIMVVCVGIENHTEFKNVLGWVHNQAYKYIKLP